MMRLTTMIALCVGGALLAGCGGGRTKLPDEPPLGVALITPDIEDDRSINQIAYNSLQVLKDRLLAKVSHDVVRPDEGGIESSIRYYAKQNVQLIICNSSRYQSSVRQVARQFPKIAFVVIGGQATEDNLMSVSFRFEEPAYLCGILAGGLTKKGRAVCIGGEAQPFVYRSFAAFANGGRVIDKYFKSKEVYTKNWIDGRISQKLADKAIKDGADIIFPILHRANLKVIDEVKAADGVYTFGVFSNQMAEASSVVAASIVVRLDDFFLDVARSVQGGRFKGKHVVFTLKNGNLDFVINPGMNLEIEARVRNRLASAKERIISGTLKVLKDDLPAPPKSGEPSLTPVGP